MKRKDLEIGQIYYCEGIPDRFTGLIDAKFLARYEDDYDGNDNRIAAGSIVHLNGHHGLKDTFWIPSVLRLATIQERKMFFLKTIK